MSSKYDIKCKVIEEEIRSVWPEWHVAGRLGGGAFGDVFQIYRDNHGIRVDSALKVIQVDSEETAVVLPAKGQAGGETEAASQSDIPDALLGEIQIMEALRGAPNIVAIEDFSFKRDGSTCSLFVRMELLTSLQKVLPGRNGQSTLSSIQEIIKLGRDVCRALVYCEKIDIIHRDIKPANLFVDRFGDYKVGDFGASRRMDTVHIAKTMTGVGTISYMAPEIFRGRSYNNTVDIYSLGLVLYQLLNNGRMPFLPEGDTYTTQDIDSANYRRLHGTPVPTLVGRSVGGEMIDSRLDAVVRRACAMDPADRYQSAKEFYDALALTETEEKKPVPVYAKRPQGSLAPDASLQNREQEGARTEIGTEPSDDPETVVSLKDLPQTRKHSGQKVRRSNSGKETRRSTSPHRDRSSHIWPQKEERRAGGNNKPVIVIVLLLIIAVAALVVVLSRGGSSGPSASTDSDAASQTEEHKQNVSGEDDTVGGSSSDTEAADTVSEGDKENVSEKDDTVDGSGSDTEAADTVSEEDKENVSEEDDTVDGSSSDTEAADTVSGEYDRALGTISDSWEEIIAAGEDGTYIDKYQIGDTKELDLGEEGVIEMELVAFDADELADGSGKAHMTWIAKDLLNTEHRMNAGWTNEGGWPASDMRAWLRDSILPLFPETVRSNIREVKKYSYSYSDKGTISSSDTIWIPSRREMFGADNAFEDEGPEYLTAFPDDASRQKQHIGVSEPSRWWLRSASLGLDDYFNGVNSDGSIWIDGSAGSVHGVVVGFCLGASSASSNIASEDDNRAPGPISDSWEEIIAAGEDGTYIDKYKIGDTKELDLGEEGVIEMELVAFDADELADGSGKAHMTWIAKDLLNTEHVMNEEDTNEGGWPASDMRAWLRDSILPLFPETVRSNIREVKKYSYSYSDNGTISSSDTIWIPSRREMFGANDSREDRGPEYLTAFPDDASRQKRCIGDFATSRWWLRSASFDYDHSFYDVYYDGSYYWYSLNASFGNGVVVGFCF